MINARFIVFVQCVIILRHCCETNKIGYNNDKDRVTTTGRRERKRTLILEYGDL